MGRPVKQTPIKVFEDNISDAERLLMLTTVLLNTRTRRIRSELRDRLGTAMKLPRRRWDELDCVESADLLVVLKPGGSTSREHFNEPELRPLLRQAIVAVAAAVESYVAEKACSLVGEALKNPPRRLLDLPLNLEQVLRIEDAYERRGWGRRKLIIDYLQGEASAHPDRIGEVFATVGKRKIWAAVDRHRSVAAGTSHQQLKALAERRNTIAHTGDRSGRGRAPLSLQDVQSHIANATEIVHALDSTTARVEAPSG